MPVNLSVVIPCYNEAKRMPATVSRVQEWLAATDVPAEVILVDDGSTDSTSLCMAKAAAAFANVRVVSLSRNVGKGRAVAEGVARTEGDYVLITDADLSAPIAEVLKLQEAITDGADIAIGSRAAQGARELDQPLRRRLMGAVFNRMVQGLLLPGVRDSQCGFKLFRGPVARALFVRLGTSGFAFDVEILWRARLAGYRVAEVAVRWLDAPGSSVRPFRHSAQMAWDVLRIWHLVASVEAASDLQPAVRPADPS